MPKLVVLNEGLSARVYELNVEQTTIGRAEGNTFQIPETSVSSHHCEIFLRSGEVVVKDLNSTNGTFINGTAVTGESVLKFGETLRLGQVEMRLENGAPISASPMPAPAATPARRQMVHTSPIPTGVSLNDLAGARTGGFDTASKAFTKKTDKGNRIFIIAVISVAVVIVIALIVISKMIKPPG